MLIFQLQFLCYCAEHHAELRSLVGGGLVFSTEHFWQLLISAFTFEMQKAQQEY